MPQRVPLATAELILAFAGLFGLALWLNQPLFLLPLASLAWLAYRDDMGCLLMLSGYHLWMLRPSEEPHPIPVTAVKGTIAGTQITVIATRDSRYPEIRVNQYQSGDLLKQLKRRLQGESAVPPREVQLESAAESVLRCTLCGRPVPGDRADGTVHICDLRHGHRPDIGTSTGPLCYRGYGLLARQRSHYSPPWSLCPGSYPSDNVNRLFRRERMNDTARNLPVRQPMGTPAC